MTPKGMRKGALFLKFWGIRPDGEYTAPAKAPRPGWSYRAARRNAARLAHWPARFRWRVFMKMIRDKLESGVVPGAVPS